MVEDNSKGISITIDDLIENKIDEVVLMPGVTAHFRKLIDQESLRHNVGLKLIVERAEVTA